MAPIFVRNCILNQYLFDLGGVDMYCRLYYCKYYQDSIKLVKLTNTNVGISSILPGSRDSQKC